MKIFLNTQCYDLINEFVTFSKDNSFELLYSKLEKGLFDQIASSDVDAFVIEYNSTYSNKAINLIKKKYPYIPVVIIGDITNVSDADIYLPSYNLYKQKYDILYKDLILAVYNNIKTYINNFQKLKKLTTQKRDVIHFENYAYDPTRRVFSYKGKDIKKLSAKEGGIIEVLSSSFGEIVKKEVILEKVWRKSDYFASRSMDVYLSHLRKMFKENNLNLTINNITGVGLILE